MARREEVRSRSRAEIAALLALLLATPGDGAAQAYHVDRGAANLVRFTSRAATETFSGRTDRVDGYVLLDGPTLGPATGSGATEVHLEVDLATLDTGIGLRNRHMRDRYLEVAKYPFAVFHGQIWRSDPEAPGRWRVTARGTLEIHGVARPRDLSCDVEPFGRGYRASCAFEVLLSDHNIEIPRIMFLRLANEISLELEFFVSPAVSNSGGSR